MDPEAVSGRQEIYFGCHAFSVLLSVTPIDSDSYMCSLEVFSMNTYMMVSGKLCVKPAICSYVIMVIETVKARVFPEILGTSHFNFQACGHLP